MQRVADRPWVALAASPDHTFLSATYESRREGGRTVVIEPNSKTEVGNFEASGFVWIDTARLMLFNWLDPSEVVQVSRREPAKSIQKFGRMEADTPGRAFDLTGQVVNADGSKAWASYSKGAGLLEFDLASNKIKTLIGGPSGAYALSVVTQDGQSGELLTGGADGYVRLWKLADLSLIKEYRIASSGYFVSDADLVAGSRRAVVGITRIRKESDSYGPAEPAKVILLDLDTGQQKKLFDLYSWRARMAIVGNKIVYPEGDRIRLTTIDGPSNTQQLRVGGPIVRTAVSANSRWLAVIDTTKKLTIFDLTTLHKKTITISVDDDGPLVVTNDGDHVYQIANEGHLTGWDIASAKATKKFLTRIQQMHTRVGFMTLANDDQWLVTAGNHHDIGIFDRTTNKLLSYTQVGGAAFYVEKVWIRGNRMIVTTDTGVMYDGVLR